MFVSRIIRVRRRDRVSVGVPTAFPPPTRSCFRRKVVAQRPLTLTGLRKPKRKSSHRELTLTKDTRYKKTRVCPTPTPTPHSSHTHIEIISGVPQEQSQEREALDHRDCAALFQNTQTPRQCTRGSNRSRPRLSTTTKKKGQHQPPVRLTSSSTKRGESGTHSPCLMRPASP